MSKSIDIALVTRDTERAVRSYRDLLGLEPAGDLRVGGIVPDGHLTRLRAGESLIKLLELDDPPERSAYLDAIGAVVGLQYLTVHVDDPVGVAAGHSEEGGEVVLEPRELRPGITIAIVRDPDGNLVELVAGL